MAINSVLTSASFSQRQITLDTNSGPLSLQGCHCECVGGAAYGEWVLQHTHDVMSGKRTPRFDRQTLSRVLVDHDQQPKLATILGSIRHKVVRPHMILVAGTVTHATVFTSAKKTSLAMLFSWDLHMLSFPQSMDTFSFTVQRRWVSN